MSLFTEAFCIPAFSFSSSVYCFGQKLINNTKQHQISQVLLRLQVILCTSFVILKIFPVQKEFFFPTERAFLRTATLIESAAACISKPVEKILLDKVEVITGEEAEHNVLQVRIS